MDLSFEEAMTMLEDTVRRLENGGLSLDESLKAFEEAVKLIKICNEKLEGAEQKVKILLENSEGIIEAKPFGEQNEN